MENQEMYSTKITPEKEKEFKILLRFGHYSKRLLRALNVLHDDKYLDDDINKLLTYIHNLLYKENEINSEKLPANYKITINYEIVLMLGEYFTIDQYLLNYLSNGDLIDPKIFIISETGNNIVDSNKWIISVLLNIIRYDTFIVKKFQWFDKNSVIIHLKKSKYDYNYDPSEDD